MIPLDIRDDHARIAEAFLTALGGMDCFDGDDRTPGVWLPHTAWLAIVEQMRNTQGGMDAVARAAA
jgi:hypothetical protein